MECVIEEHEYKRVAFEIVEDLIEFLDDKNENTDWYKYDAQYIKIALEKIVLNGLRSDVWITKLD